MAITIWIDNVLGNDGNIGDDTHPKATFDGALLIAGQGDTIRAKNTGVNYSGLLNHSLTVGATFKGTDYDTDPGLIIEGYPDDDWPVIELPIGVNPAKYWMRFAGAVSPVTPCDYVWVRNFHFTSAPGTTYRPWVYYIHKLVNHVRIDCSDFGGMYPWYGGDPIRYDPSGGTIANPDIEIAGCFLMSTGGFNIYMVQCGPWALWLHHCLFVGSGGSYDHAIRFDYVLTGSVVMEQNTFYMMYQAAGSGVISVFASVDVGPMTVRDNIFAGANYAYYCGTSDNAHITEYNNCYVGVTNFCNTRPFPIGQCRCNINGLSGKSPTSIDIDPDFVGGGAADWLIGLTFPTSFEPQEPQVLTGSHAGRCIGGWLPMTEGYPLRCSPTACIVDPVTLDFGTVPLGSHKTLTFTVTNTGGDAIGGTITSSCPDITVLGGESFIIGPGETRTFVARFRPQSVGAKVCILTVGMCGTITATADVSVCDYDAFTGQYPADWQAELARKVGCAPVTIVCFDPDGQKVLLSCMLKEMAPITMSLDLGTEEIQIEDATISFIDPTQYLDPFMAGSLLYDDVDPESWRNSVIEVGTWLVGTEKVLRHARLYLTDSKRDGQNTIWTCKDKFQLMFKRHIRANVMLPEDVDYDTEESYTLDVETMTLDSLICPIGEWRVHFINSLQYELYSEQVGFDGTGDIGAGFTSDSGAITIPAAAWSMGGNEAHTGDEITFLTVLVLDRQHALECLRTVLTSYYDATYPDDFDVASWTEAEAASVFLVIDVVQKDPITALEFTRRISRHVAGAVYLGPDGKLKVWRASPTARPEEILATCSYRDLKKLTYKTTDIEDVVISHYGPTADGDLGLTQRLPASIAKQGGAIPPLPYFEAENRIIFEFDLEYYVWKDSTWVATILDYTYELKTVGRRLLDVNSKLDLLNAHIGGTIWIDSDQPDEQFCGTIVKMQKDLIRRDLTFTVLDTEGWLAVCATGGCGCMWYDNEPPNYYDDCWFYC